MIRMEASWHLPAHPEAVGKARDLTREALHDWGLDPLTDDVILMVSELVTNALVHARPAIRLSVEAQGAILCAMVADQGPLWAPAGLPPMDDLSAEHGRGLAIVNAYAEKWGIDPTPDGKQVWFQMRIPW